MPRWEDAAARATAPPTVEQLTARENNVLEPLAACRTNGEIARELYISAKTASVHASNILRKLGVTNRVEAAALVSARSEP